MMHRNEQLHASKERLERGFPTAVAARFVDIDWVSGIREYDVVLDNERIYRLKSHPRDFTPAFAALLD